MKVSARLNFITLQAQRSAWETSGEVEIDGAVVRISFLADTYAMQIISDGNTATVTRSGENAYTLPLCEAHDTLWTMEGMQASVHTEKLRLHTNEGQISFMAKYRISGGEATQVIVKAYF